MATDILIVGAGPGALACAISAKEHGLSCVLLEQGNVVDAIRRFPQNLVWFSTPELLEIGGIPFAIPTTRPTRVDTLSYYQKVAERYALDIRPFDAATAIHRDADGFVVTTARGVRHSARFVVIATGYFDHPGRLGVPGEDLTSVMHYYGEPFAYTGCKVTIVGGRNSAVEAALDLYRHGAQVTLVHRGEQLSTGVKYWIQPDFDNRVKAGQITAHFGARVREIRDREVLVDTSQGPHAIPTEFTFVLIGYLPDAAFLRAQGIQVDLESLAPQHNPETFETNVPGLFVAGSVVAGRNTNKIFVENGRLHGSQIVSAIMKRLGGSAKSEGRSED
jgi:thioredoxin reductase (NADPH)